MDKDLKRFIAGQLRACRRAAKLNQAELAERIDRTSEAISNIERGKSLPALDTLMAHADKDCPIFVLDHQPYGVAEADALGVDLLFCGHTHRGQVWPLTWVTDKLFEQSHGYRRWSHAHVYVSQGLSLWGPPFRIGSSSELVVFKIK